MTLNEFIKLPDFEKTVVIKENATFLNKYPMGVYTVYYYSFQSFFIEVVINFKEATYKIKVSEKNFTPANLFHERRLSFYRENNFSENLN
jgi:hypothetical protein